jgi:hypothetical protein
LRERSSDDAVAAAPRDPPRVPEAMALTVALNLAAL